MASLSANLRNNIGERIPESVRQSLLIGLLLGGGGITFGLLTALGGPLVGFGALIGLGVALYVLTDLMAGLLITLATMCVLPFATIPVKIAVTPTLIDCGMAAFLLVYLFQYMTGRRTRPRFVPAHLLIVAYAVFLIFSFVAGLGHAPLNTTTARRFAEMILSVGFAIVLVDVVRDRATLRRIVLALCIIGAGQAILGLGLYVLNDATAERLLNTLGRFGYPQGGVIRYVNDNPLDAERAIGTWVDPNAYGGFLLVIAVLCGSQVLSEQPITGKRWIAVALFAPVALAIYLTQSRAALLALVAAVAFIGVMRYRWLLGVLVLAGALFLTLPFTQGYVERLIDGIQNEDISTQMRVGEYKDAITLITRYPLIGVGFSGAPDRDIYLGVSSMYLRIAGSSGFIGLTLFLLTIAEVFRYGLTRWKKIAADRELITIWLGCAAAIIGMMVVGVFDHYYANFEFHGSVLLFWTVIGLALVAARLTDEAGTA
jgi:polysaccharide biosynthesis protein PslJ